MRSRSIKKLKQENYIKSLLSEIDRLLDGEGFRFKDIFSVDSDIVLVLEDCSLELVSLKSLHKDEYYIVDGRELHGPFKSLRTLIRFIENEAFLMGF